MADDNAQGGGTGADAATTKPPANPSPPPPPAEVAKEESAPAPDEGEHKDPWAPPRVTDIGVAVDAKGLPINRRLRALALAMLGEAKDEDGLVEPELIADAAERARAHEEAYPPIPANATTAFLDERADLEGVDLEGAANNAERAERILTRRPALV